MLPQDLPYRPNVSALIVRADGKLLAARRTDMPGAGGPLSEGIWQCPQGGIDAGEDTRHAVLRELHEELGTDKFIIKYEYPEWIPYDLPEHLIGKALGGRYRGQTQKWFVVEFLGKDSDINLAFQNPPEFDVFQWVSPAEFLSLDLGFKKALYEHVLAHYISRP